MGPGHKRVTGPVHSRRSWSGLALGAAAVAAGLGAAALYNAARAKAAERRHPPVGRFLNVDGVRLHYLDRGQGDPIVLLHGNGALIQEMTASGVVARLAERHRVVVFDRPGFGYSERPRTRLWSPAEQARVLAKALDQLGIRKAVVYGHSFGTLVAVQLALQDPGRVLGLVLGAGFFYPRPRLDVALLSPPALPVVGDVMRYTISPPLTEALLPNFYRKLFEPRPVSPRFRDGFPHELMLRPSHIRAAAADTALLIPAAENLSGRYRELDVPVTIVAGEDDAIVDSEKNSVRLHRELQGSRLLLIPEVGHMVHHSAPEVVIGAIEALFRLADGDGARALASR